MDEENAIRQRYELLAPELNERALRLFAAAEAKVIGWGGVAIVARALGISRERISRGLAELETGVKPQPGRIRRQGGGRKKETDKDPTLKKDLESLIEPFTRGDPDSPLRWTCKSVRRLAKELKEMGHKTSHRMVAELLREMKYSLQANSKTKEGNQHPDRNAQFEYINKRVRAHQKSNQPVISVDTKKKELVGDFKNAGREWQKQGEPEKVRVHDFIDKKLGKVAPYGVYDLSRNDGWVSVGIDHDTAAFAVHSIREWWRRMGKKAYLEVRTIQITADSGGSNSSRSRLWKWELQKLANQTGLNLRVCHFPPETSKWNKIEHRMFSFITKNWRGKPLLSHAVIINLIASTTTETGLKIQCQLDKNEYPKGIKISDEQMNQINIKRDDFHGDWNYTIHPNKKKRKTKP